MSEDPRSGTWFGIVVFCGSIAALFLIARVTHIALALARDLSRIPVEAIGQVAFVVVAGVAAIGIAHLAARWARGSRPGMPHGLSHRAS